MATLNWFFDFHSHIDVNIGSQPNVQEIAQRLSDAGVSEMSMFAKGHCGFTFYPTTLPKCYPHPKMVGDPLGSVVNACHKKGLITLAYLSFGVDGHGARINPLWAKCNAEHIPSYSAHHFIHTCPYTPYTQESVLPQIDEVLNRYPVSGFFFDTMSALSPCYCPFCLKAFRQTFSFDPPRKPADPHWSQFGRWRRDRGMALLGSISQFIQDRKPGAIVAFNQIGCPPVPEAMPPGCTRLSLDFATSGPQSRQASRCAAYGSTAPRPAEVMPTIFNSGWGDWSPAPDLRHHQIAAAIWARNGTATFGDRLHPDVKLTNPTRSALASLAQFKLAFEKHAPSPGVTPNPDILILHAQSMQYGPDFSTFCINEQGRLKPLNGATDLLLDAGENYSVVAEYCLADNLTGVQAIVLPHLPAITPDTDELLHAFADRGGQVLIVGLIPHVNSRPLSWAGIHDSPNPWQDHIYLPSLDPAELADPILVRGTHHQTTAQSDVTVISCAIPPVDMRFGISMGWGIAPPSDFPSQSPVLSRRAIGSNGGAVWVLSAELFTSYQSQGNWQQVRYASQLMRRILPQPSLRIDSTYGQVEAVLYQGAASSWVNLVNHAGETLAHGPRQWPRTWGPLPIHDITLQLTGPASQPPQNVTLSGHSVPFTFDSERKRLQVPVILAKVIQTLRVDW
jgi:hypothetical protein